MEYMVPPGEVRNWNVVVWKGEVMYRRGHYRGEIGLVAKVVVGEYPWADKIWVGFGGGVWHRRNKRGWVIER